MSLQINYKQLIPKLEVIAKKNSTAEAQGNYKSSFKGEGVEFYEYSQYLAGENAKKIDWKASLRVQKLLKKEFLEERNINVFFLVETSAKMLAGSSEKIKAEYAAELVNVLATLAARTGENIGYALFNKELISSKMPHQTNHVLYLLRKDLINTNNYKKGYNLAAALRFLINHLQRNSILFIVSDFISLSPRDIKELKIAMNKFDVIGLVIRDKLDMEIPEHDVLVMIESPLIDEQIVVNPSKLAEQYKKNAIQDIKSIVTLFRNNRADIGLFFTDEYYISQLLKLFDKRNKR